ncbi:MAG: hypothetical protein J5671_03430 [Bacteroidaceae bacterium]|nr:hypothetical protein [Bacteroidaceae bacterium]
MLRGEYIVFEHNFAVEDVQAFLHTTEALALEVVNLLTGLRGADGGLYAVVV